jgi:hypothetical protein
MIHEGNRATVAWIDGGSVTRATHPWMQIYLDWSLSANSLMHLHRWTEMLVVIGTGESHYRHRRPAAVMSEYSRSNTNREANR